MMTRITRRIILRDLGRTTLGLVVVGWGVACSSDDPVIEVPPSGTAGTGPGGVATEPSSSPPPASEPAAAATQALTVDLDFVAAYVMVRAGEAALVDTGVAGSEAAILAVLEEAGLGWGDLGHVILTHSHPDHAGSAAAVAELAPDAGLYAGAADIPAITVPRDLNAVGNGDSVFGFDVVETPGHTPGHICVYDPATRLLLAGDALSGRGGAIAGPDPRFTPDLPTANDSVAIMAQLDVDQVLVAHGFPVEGGTAELAALAESL